MDASAPNPLLTAGLPAAEVARWEVALGVARWEELGLPGAAALLGRVVRAGEALLGRLPAKAARGEAEAAAAGAVHERLRRARAGFLRAHVGAVYRELTDGEREFVRAEALVYRAAERFPGLAPTRAAVLAERELLQRDKEGLEIDQGMFLSHVLSHRRAGAHLVHAMLRPRPEALERLPAFCRDGVADLGGAHLERRGAAAILSLHNPRFLNAEDDSTIDALEIGADLALLDPAVEVGFLRGSVARHPRYAGRHVFNAGINLTHLYHGKISFLFFITREMGFINKLYRGLSGPEFRPGEPEDTLEKPWIGVVEAFAIGGGAQLLLVMDQVLAEEGAFFNLPARKEGIIPGLANLRLPRFFPDQLARQAILFDRSFDVSSPDGRLVVSRVVPRAEMDRAIEEVAAALTTSGLVSAQGNRKALRVGQEPLATFQAYMATYAREQAFCHFSSALIANLERYWVERQKSNVENPPPVPF